MVGGPRFVRRLARLPRAVVHHLYSRFDPTGYARWIGVKMGDGVRVYGQVNWGTEPCLIRLGNNVHVTHECVFLTHDGGTLILRREVNDLEITAPIVVGSDVYIGLRAMIMPGVTIGNRVIIGAGSIVTRDIPDNSVAVGVPAKIIRTVDEYLAQAKEKSLHLGHLKGDEKLKELRRLFNA